MIRKAFIMAVNPDKEAEYRKRHEKIWPDMHQMLKEHGVSNCIRIHYNSLHTPKVRVKINGKALLIPGYVKGGGRL